MISPELFHNLKLINPINSPSSSNKGPPLLPSLITIEVCITVIKIPLYSTYLNGDETFPSENDNPMPFGFPIVYRKIPSYTR